MSPDLLMKEFLENSTECSKRIRTILTILVVVTVLIFSGFLNSWQGYAWNISRIKYKEEYTKQLKIRITRLHEQQKELKVSPYEFIYPETLPEPFIAIPPSYGYQDCTNILETWTLSEQIRCYEGAKALSEKFLEDSVKTYVDSTYLVRVPFFGVAFDINDLGAIGGLSLIVILIMLRLNLRNFIVSLRIGFKAAKKVNLQEEFYDILAGRQLFAFPSLQDPEQDPYAGQTEKIWSESRGKSIYESVVKVGTSGFDRIKRIWWAILKILLLSKSPDPQPQCSLLKTDFEPQEREATINPSTQASELNKGWHSNPHPLLTLVPTWICLVPAVVYAAVVINDFFSYKVGEIVNKVRAQTGFAFSLLCLVIIFTLGCWCVSKWIEIDALWKAFNVKGSRGRDQ